MNLAAREGSAQAAQHTGIARQVDQIFESNPINTVRIIHRNQVDEINAKKQELRLLVGHRYRDLIDCADSIVAIKDCVENVQEKLNDVEENCVKLRGTIRLEKFAAPITVIAKDGQSVGKKYALAKQIKFLMDTPEKIWMALESFQLQIATDLYLSAESVHASLYGDPESRHLVANMPLLERQWSTISQFPEKIKDKSKSRLAHPTLNSMDYAQALFSLILLDKCSIIDSFEQFFEGKKKAIMNALPRTTRFVDPSDSQKRLKTLASILMKTIYQVYVLYLNSGTSEDKINDHGVLMNLLQTHTTQSKFNYSPIPIEHIQEKCSKWLNMCIEAIQKGGAVLLQAFTMAEELCELEKNVWGELQEVEGYHVSWGEVCLQIVKRPVNLWMSPFREIFIQRGKKIVEERFESLDIIDFVESEMKTVEVNPSFANLGGFVWDPTEEDTVQSIKQKASATPMGVRTILERFDNRLSSFMGDLSFLLKVSPNPQEITITKKEDVEQLKTYIEERCYQQVMRIAAKIGGKRKLLENQIESHSAGLSELKARVDQILFLGRICSRLAAESTQLPAILSSAEGDIASKTASDKTRPSYRATPLASASKSLPKKENRWLTDLRNTLKSHYYAAHCVWSQWLALNSVETVRKYLYEDDWVHGSLRLRMWETISHVITNENGTESKEEVQIPYQCSFYVTSMLFEVCQEIHRVSAHSTDNGVISYAAYVLGIALVNEYKSFWERKKAEICKEGKAQVLLDLQYIFALLSAGFSPNTEMVESSKSITTFKEFSTKGADLKMEFNSIIAEVRNALDPIDLAFYKPLLEEHVKKCYLQSKSFYGLVTAGNNQYRDAKLSSSIQGKHNIMVLATEIRKFNTLPISSLRSRKPR